MSESSLKFVTRCWQCGETHDCVTSINNELVTPNDGDVTMCLECGAFGIFDRTREENLRKPDPAETFQLKNHKELQRAHFAWTLYMDMLNKD